VIDERKHIDNYFSDSLEEHIDENLDLDLNWKAVDQGLSKYSFFRFQMNRFNIYYLGAIFLNVVVLCWVMIYTPEYPIVDSNESSGISESSIDSLNSDLSIKSSHDSKSIQKFSSHSKNPTEKNGINSYGADTSVVDSTHLKAKDGTNTSIFNATDLPTKTDSMPSKKIKPPVVINRKRDTIMRVDTLFVNKKKKLKNK
jgi:hypothetical protein